MNKIHYIIGDIHGESDLLESLLDAILARHHWRYSDAYGVLVYLGDYIDRGPNSKKVIELATRENEGFSNIHLKGNHEALLLNCLETDQREVWNTWMAAGGEVTLRSFGYDLFKDLFDPKRLSEALGEGVLAWLKSLRLFYQYSDFLCVHAGLKPGVEIGHQDEKDLLWIRRQFLESDVDFGRGIIHGHTPSDAPIVRANRIGIDTGAGQQGELTALVVDKPWVEMVADPTFISTN